MNSKVYRYYWSQDRRINAIDLGSLEQVYTYIYSQIASDILQPIVEPIRSTIGSRAYKLYDWLKKISLGKDSGVHCGMFNSGIYRSRLHALPVFKVYDYDSRLI